jgi:starch synthase
MNRILFVTSEAYPLIKTGGLADVSGSLPLALKARGHDVRILMPAYGDLLAELNDVTAIIVRQANSAIEILEARLPNSDVPVWLLAHTGTFDRTGNPYLGADGKPWADNAERFALLARCAVEIAMDRLSFRWKPDIVHCNDWQTGLIPALLEDEPKRPATVFTIHNLAYQGLFPKETLERLVLPKRLWSPHGLEFYDQLSFIKGGLVFADRINTVSPNYAKEIQGEEFGCGMEGLLRSRSGRLNGILNGIDADAWNPATDNLIAQTYDTDTLTEKAVNKSALRKKFGLKDDDEQAVVAMVGRMVQQKGIDLVIDILPELIKLPMQLVVLGSGEKRYEQTLRQWAQLYPDRIALTVGYNEELSHLIEAGADIFLMPSRFEPCGLNQMYSQRYGTVPIVRRVGGLADTVDDINPTNLTLGTASGIVFDEAQDHALLQAVERAVALFQNKPQWEKLQRTGMNKDFSWQTSAKLYEKLYELAEADRNRVGHSMLIARA